MDLLTFRRQLVKCVGGRILSAYLWTLWILSCLIVHFLISRFTTGEFRISTIIAFLVVAGGWTLIVFDLIRLFRSPAKKMFIMKAQPDSIRVSPLVRSIVWILPVLALGTVVSPIYFNAN